MVIKNEECLSCHVIIIKNCIDGKYEKMVTYLLRMSWRFTDDENEGLAGFGECCPAAAEWSLGEC
jgi:hypothetical protein